MAEMKIEAIVVTCMDPRFQEMISSWITKNGLDNGRHSRVAWAGGVLDWDKVFGQIKVSKRLHDINRAILMNHENCGGYGESGTPEKHAEDLRNAMSEVEEELPGVKAEGYYLHLDGVFEKIDP